MVLEWEQDGGWDGRGRLIEMARQERGGKSKQRASKKRYKRKKEQRSGRRRTCTRGERETEEGCREANRREAGKKGATSCFLVWRHAGASRPVGGMKVDRWTMLLTLYSYLYPVFHRRFIFSHFFSRILFWSFDLSIITLERNVNPRYTKYKPRVPY